MGKTLSKTSSNSGQLLVQQRWRHALTEEIRAETAAESCHGVRLFADVGCTSVWKVERKPAFPESEQTQHLPHQKKYLVHNTDSIQRKKDAKQPQEYVYVDEVFGTLDADMAIGISRLQIITPQLHATGVALCG